MITGEGAAVLRNREYLGGEEYATRLARVPQALTDELSAVRKSENGRDKETAVGKLKSGFGITAPQNAAAPATPQQPEVQSKSYVLEKRSQQRPHRDVQPLSLHLMLRQQPTAN
jgi:hypothetical protein